MSTLVRRVAILLFLLGPNFFFLRYAVLNWLGNYLIVSDLLEHTDAIVILSGDPLTRCQAAADLYWQGWAPRLIITKGIRSSEQAQLKSYGIYELETHEKCLKVLTFNAVPERVIEVLDGYNESTTTEVLKIQQRVHAQDLKRLVIVTSNFHTRRSRMLFRRGLKRDNVEVLVYAAPPNFIFDPLKWWTRPYDRKTLFTEYQKLCYYAARFW